MSDGPLPHIVEIMRACDWTTKSKTPRAHTEKRALKGLQHRRHAEKHPWYAAD